MTELESNILETHRPIGTRVTIKDHLKALRRMQSELLQRADYFDVLAADASSQDAWSEVEKTADEESEYWLVSLTGPLRVRYFKAEAEECRSTARILGLAEGEICSD